MYFFILFLQVTKFPSKELPVLPVFSTPANKQTKHLRSTVSIKCHWLLILPRTITCIPHQMSDIDITKSKSCPPSTTVCNVNQDIWRRYKKCQNNMLIQPLMAQNWQKLKSTFLTCPCHKIYRVEAVNLKSSNYTFKKIMIFVKMWNLGQFCEN